MRADKFFAEKYGSRTKAQAVLAQGLILKDGKPLAPDSELNGGEEFTFLELEQSFVSNGGYKLSRGLDFFGETVAGKVLLFYNRKEQKYQQSTAELLIIKYLNVWT